MRIVTAVVAGCLLAGPAMAQQPAQPQQSPQAAFAAALASNLSTALAENAALQQQVAECKAAHAPAPAKEHH